MNKNKNKKTIEKNIIKIIMLKKKLNNKKQHDNYSIKVCNV